jgi:hypothetical protein
VDSIGAIQVLRDLLDLLALKNTIDSSCETAAARWAVAGYRWSANGLIGARPFECHVPGWGGNSYLLAVFGLLTSARVQARDRLKKIKDRLAGFRGLCNPLNFLDILAIQTEVGYVLCRDPACAMPCFGMSYAVPVCAMPWPWVCAMPWFCG